MALPWANANGPPRRGGPHFPLSKPGGLGPRRVSTHPFNEPIGGDGFDSVTSPSKQIMRNAQHRSSFASSSVHARICVRTACSRSSCRRNNGPVTAQWVTAFACSRRCRSAAFWDSGGWKDVILAVMPAASSTRTVSWTAFAVPSAGNCVRCARRLTSRWSPPRPVVISAITSLLSIWPPPHPMVSLAPVSWGAKRCGTDGNNRVVEWSHGKLLKCRGNSVSLRRNADRSDPPPEAHSSGPSWVDCASQPEVFQSFLVDIAIGWRNVLFHVCHSARARGRFR